MNPSIKNIKGMPDLLPEQLVYWQYVEKTIKKLLDNYGYKEIRLPIVEYTELFKRSIGEVTDIVEKEMYTFPDRHGDLLTLRPEGTAGCVRACLQQGLLANEAQHRLWYQGPMFRYENPQKGRQRQFHQLGIETFGVASAEIDLELIVLAYRIFQTLGVAEFVELQINTIGSVESRKRYKLALIEYLEAYKDQLDADCLRRLYTNPMRILDSKSPHIQLLLDKAPMLHDYINEESVEHFGRITNMLDALAIPYKINQRLVRGLDYYNKTVFEFVTQSLGAQGTVCAGGRYDGLVEQLGGASYPAVGFAIGLERLALLLEVTATLPVDLTSMDIYFVVSGDADVYRHALIISNELRKSIPELKMILHCGGGSIKSQMKKADKSGAAFALIVGSNEVEQGVVSLKPLRQDYGSEQKTLQISELSQAIQSLIH